MLLNLTVALALPFTIRFFWPADLFGQPPSFRTPLALPTIGLPKFFRHFTDGSLRLPRTMAGTPPWQQSYPQVL